ADAVALYEKALAIAPYPEARAVAALELAEVYMDPRFGEEAIAPARAVPICEALLECRRASLSGNFAHRLLYDYVAAMQACSRGADARAVVMSIHEDEEALRFFHKYTTSGLLINMELRQHLHPGLPDPQLRLSCLAEMRKWFPGDAVFHERLEDCIQRTNSEIEATLTPMTRELEDMFSVDE
ncbi:MAG: hypothetical protein JXR94_06695, partial [Candidatus Hydrogenedentes bacterium]|nr:hypothetical protein [Candidatus Hydrogenedentota bacterium]